MENKLTILICLCPDIRTSDVFRTSGTSLYRTSVPYQTFDLLIAEIVGKVSGPAIIDGLPTRFGCRNHVGRPTLCHTHSLMRLAGLSFWTEVQQPSDVRLVGRPNPAGRPVPVSQPIDLVVRLCYLAWHFERPS